LHRTSLVDNLVATCIDSIGGSGSPGRFKPTPWLEVIDQLASQVLEALGLEVFEVQRSEGASRGSHAISLDQFVGVDRLEEVEVATGRRADAAQAAQHVASLF